MKALLRIAATASFCMALFTSCEKREKPHPFPPPGDAMNGQVNMGSDYKMQVFFSFTGGVIDSSRNDSWDLSFTNDPETNELRTNGGSDVYIRSLGTTDFEGTTDTLFAETSWAYDDPSGLKGTSNLGDLIANNHLNEVLLVKKFYTENAKKRVRLYKLQVLEAGSEKYVIKKDTITGTAGTVITLNRDQDYNFSYFSFADGIVQPEPPKATWDIVFTRYLHVYKNYNPDGSDFPYLVNGALLNPYLTTAGDDSTKDFDFNQFALTDAEQFTLIPNRDVIGFDWKSVDINTGIYTVLSRKVFVVNTQSDQLWKLHFVGFYKDGQRGSPQFEYIRLK